MMTTPSSPSSNYHHTTAVGGCGSSLPVVIPPRSTTPPSSTMSGPSTATVAMTVTMPTGRGTSSSGLSFVPHRRCYPGPSLSASASSASKTTGTTTTSRRKHRLTRRTYNSNNRNDYAYYGDTTANVDSDSSGNSSHLVVDSADVNNARYHRAVAFMQHFRRLHSLDIIDEHEDDSTMTKMKTMKRSETTSCLTSLVVDVEEDEENCHHNGRTGGGGRGGGDDDGHHAASSVSASHYNFKNKRSRHLSFVEDDYVSDIDSIVEEEGLHDEEDDRHYGHHDHHDNE